MVERIVALLRANRVSFSALTHPPCITSMQAREVRGPWAQGAVALKALVVRVVPKRGSAFEGMVVVPGDERFASAVLRQHFSARDVRLVGEEELPHLTQGVERGGVPPLGSVLWGMPLVADARIRGEQLVVFNAGDRCASIKMQRNDWERIAQPTWLEGLARSEAK